MKDYNFAVAGAKVLVWMEMGECNQKKVTKR